MAPESASDSCLMLDYICACYKFSYYYYCYYYYYYCCQYYQQFLWITKAELHYAILVANKSEAGRRPAASWNLAYHLAR